MANLTPHAPTPTGLNVNSFSKATPTN